MKVHSDYLEQTNIMLRKADRYDSNELIYSKINVDENFKQSIFDSFYSVQEKMLKPLILVNQGEECKVLPMSHNACLNSSVFYSNEENTNMAKKYNFN